MGEVTGGLFYITLNMSISGGAVIVCAFLLRAVKPIPRRYSYAFWAIPALRLALPFVLSSPVSLWRLGGRFIARMVPAGEVLRGANLPMYMMNFVGAAGRHDPISYRTEALARVFHVAGDVWMIGACAALVAVAALYGMTAGALKKSVRVRGDLYENPLISSPVLFGVFRPKIIFPSAREAESGAACFVIAHERVHIRRHDNLWRMCALVIACVQWFNPLVWLMLRAFYTDMELSCDEAVVQTLSARARRDYAGALVHFADSGRFVLSAAFGTSRVRVRVEKVLSYRKMTAVASSALLLFFAAATLAFLTNP